MKEEGKQNWNKVDQIKKLFMIQSGKLYKTIEHQKGRKYKRNKTNLIQRRYSVHIAPVE